MFIMLHRKITPRKRANFTNQNLFHFLWINEKYLENNESLRVYFILLKKCNLLISLVKFSFCDKYFILETFA